MRKNQPETISFAKLHLPVEMPHLLDIQVQFFDMLLQKDTPPDKRKKEGLEAVFQEVFPIVDYQENYTLEFVEYSLGEPKYTVEECQERDMTYSIPLKATLRLITKEAVGNKKKIGFLVNATGNATWISYVLYKWHTFGLLLVVIPAFFINVRNYTRWFLDDRDNGFLTIGKSLRI